MNEDVSNIINNFSNILKEKDIDLTQIIGAVNSQDSNTGQDKTSPNNITSNNFNIDINTILKLKQILNVMNAQNIPRNNLLNSLKPFLRKEKQEKLEEYIKYANLLSLLEIMNDGGIFKNDKQSDTHDNSTKKR